MQKRLKSILGLPSYQKTQLKKWSETELFQELRRVILF